MHKVLLFLNKQTNTTTESYQSYAQDNACQKQKVSCLIVKCVQKEDHFSADTLDFNISNMVGGDV